MRSLRFLFFALLWTGILSSVCSDDGTCLQPPPVPVASGEVSISQVPDVRSMSRTLEVRSASKIYQSGSETGNRYNPQSTDIVYNNCYLSVNPGETHLALERVVIGIRRVASGGVLTNVGLNIFAAEMTRGVGNSLGRGASFLLFSTASLGGGTSSFTQFVDTNVLTTSVNLKLELTVGASLGLGGYWIGVQFTGPNAFNSNNGWRLTNLPTIGRSNSGYFGQGSSDISLSSIGLLTFVSGVPNIFYLEAYGSPFVGPIINGDFEAPNTISPWLVNPFNGGSSTCPTFSSPNPNQCELIQQNAISGLSNSGRISVGRCLSASCGGTGSQGRNVYQDGIMVCPGNTIKAVIGVQDSRNSATIARFNTTFSLVVGDDSYELLGGPSAVVASYTFNGGLTPYTQLQTANIVGIFTAPNCVTGPANYAVGVRIERDDQVRPEVRAFLDNVVVLDLVKPIVTASAIEARATSCGGTAIVTMTATATDNCGGSPALSYSYFDGSTTVTFTGTTRVFPVGIWTVTVTATDASLNVQTATFIVTVKNMVPTITCNNIFFDTQTCWSSTYEGALATISRCGRASLVYDWLGDIQSSLSSYEFPTGNNWVTASLTVEDGVGGQDVASCKINVHPKLCCQLTPPVAPTKRSLLPFPQQTEAKNLAPLRKEGVKKLKK